MPSARRKPIERLSAAQARRMALAAQGFADPRAGREPDGWALRRVLDRVGLIQIDSVNVLQRAHYLPLFSRLGPYDTRAARPRRAPRAAAAVRVLGPRGVAAAGGHPAAAALADGARAATTPGAACGASQRERPELVERVLEEVARPRADRRQRGRSRTSARRAPARGGTGRTSSARSSGCSGAGRSPRARRRGFERLYDLPERVLPARGRSRRRRPSLEDAQRELVRIAARALRRRRPSATCATTSACRWPRRAPRVAELVEAGELWPVEVEGWTRARATCTRRRGCRARSTPARWSGRSTRWSGSARAWSALFGFRYRIEIYVPDAEARARLLRAAVPARRPARRARRPQGRPRGRACCACRPPTRSRTRRRRRPTRSPPSSPRWRAGSGSDGVAVQPRGDLAAPLAAAA